MGRPRRRSDGPAPGTTAGAHGRRRLRRPTRGRCGEGARHFGKPCNLEPLYCAGGGGGNRILSRHTSNRLMLHAFLGQEFDSALLSPRRFVLYSPRWSSAVIPGLGEILEESKAVTGRHGPSPPVKHKKWELWWDSSWDHLENGREQFRTPGRRALEQVGTGLVVFFHPAGSCLSRYSSVCLCGRHLKDNSPLRLGPVRPELG